MNEIFFNIIFLLICFFKNTYFSICFKISWTFNDYSEIISHLSLFRHYFPEILSKCNNRKCCINRLEHSKWWGFWIDRATHLQLFYVNFELWYFWNCFTYFLALNFKQSRNRHHLCTTVMQELASFFCLVMYKGGKAQESSNTL